MDLDQRIEERILVLRGQRVMLDRDLAALYGVAPFRLREQVKRNAERFPKSFTFQLTTKELREVVSQFAIPSHSHTGGALPYAFTEHGVLMLANVIRSEHAIQMSIRIIELFVRMRQMIQAQEDILVKLERLEERVTTNDEHIGTLFEHIRQLLAPVEEAPSPRLRIGYKKDEL